jgi:hypothetical protein
MYALEMHCVVVLMRRGNAMSCSLVTVWLLSSTHVRLGKVAFARRRKVSVSTEQLQALLHPLELRYSTLIVEVVVVFGAGACSLSEIVSSRILG